MDVATAAQRTLGLSHVYVITASVPPHRAQPSASSFHRFAMTAIALAGLDGWIASDVELRMPAPSYTSNTLKTFHEQGYDPDELFFVIGADAFAEIGAWRDYPHILDASHFAVVSRPGHSVKGLAERLPALAPRMTQRPAGDVGHTATWIFLIDATTIKKIDRKSTRLNSSHRCNSYAVFCLKKKKRHAPARKPRHRAPKTHGARHDRRRSVAPQEAHRRPH